MLFDDEEVIGKDVVRSFVLTGGRTQADGAVIDLKFETRVQVRTETKVPLQFERLDIARYVQSEEVISVAEIAAALGLPILTTQVLVSDLVADDVLFAYETLDSQIDLSSLSDIRSAILSL